MIEGRVPHTPADDGSKREERMLSEGLTSSPSPERDTRSRDTAVPVRIGHYLVSHALGQGGMGVVFAAHDERLDRGVAVKRMTSLGDETARKRFWREARVAASVNHPNVCQIYEIGEDAGELFIAMELLEGAVLSERLRGGPLHLVETVPIALEMLSALTALHSRGIVHRDLKPSNVFLTAHGVKLLDFGLARPEREVSISDATHLTGTGLMVGTPRYMAPEQIAGEAVGPATDLFATGAILFEMLAGRPAFTGRTLVDILHATQYEQPPALTGSPAIAAVDRVIRKALAKRGEDRPASAEVMAEELRAVRGIDATGVHTLAHTFTRLVVLPFRVLRPDPETDFLAFSLPDAITSSLSGIGSLVLRSSAVASRFAGEAPDLKALTTEADVDRVVMGTLLRAGDQLRATVQLVESPSGTLLAAHTVQSPLGDLFRLQDDIARRVVDALAPPLTSGAASTPDAPAHSTAYALYLRANGLARTYDGLAEARDLYLRCVELDPRFAPAWARLGRCYRVLGKYVDGAPDSEARAEEAFTRALSLNPRLSLAHESYANLEADIGQATRAVVRLLGEASRHGNDPELFAGLVHACRYCGLFEQSIRAHEEARRLDPNVPTSLDQTLLVMGDIDRLLTVEPPPIQAGADDGIRVIGLALAGRREEARRALERMRHQRRIPAFQSWMDYLSAWLDGSVTGMAGRMGATMALKIQEDPEAVFQEGWLLCDIGEHRAGLDYLTRGVAKGYFVAATLRSSPQFDALRGDPAFTALVADAEAGRERALAAFRDAGGDRLLGS